MTEKQPLSIFRNLDNLPAGAFYLATPTISQKTVTLKMFYVFF